MTNNRVHAEFWKLKLPFRREIHTVVGKMAYSQNVLVRLQDGEGQVGVGYAGVAAPALDRTVALTLRLLNECNGRLGSLAEVERLQERRVSPEEAGKGRLAACAISLATWDLLGRQRGLACADLWGRAPNSAALPCYGSGFFAEVATEDLTAEAERFRTEGFRLVKMRPGANSEEDHARKAAVQRVYDEPGTIALDAYLSLDVDRTKALIEGSPISFLWVEDPVPYAQIGGLADAAAPIAAGEICGGLPALVELFEKGVRYLLPDVGMMGGPVRWLEAARALSAMGARVGGHVYPTFSAHLLACLTDPLPVECIDWQDPPYVERVELAENGAYPVAGPGFGVTLDEKLLRQHGERVATV